jgi:hypothetical protein
MGIITEKLKQSEPAKWQKSLTLGRIIAEAPIIKQTHAAPSTRPLGRLGGLDNQSQNKGLTGLKSIAKAVSRPIFWGVKFFYMKLKNKTK